ncbi:MAG: hypothetical protein AAF975_02270 [Spirochaetota bacterium]
MFFLWDITNTRHTVRFITLLPLVFAIFHANTLGAETKKNRPTATPPAANEWQAVKPGAKAEANTEPAPHNPRQQRRHVIHVSPLIEIAYGRDKGFSLYSRTVLSGGAKIGYDYRGRKIQNELIFAGGGGTGFPPYRKLYEPAADIAFWLDFADTFLFHLIPQTNENPWQFSLGAEAAFRVSAWIPNRLNYSFFIALEFKPVARLSWQFQPRHRLGIDLTLPFIGVGWRPPWSGLSTLLEKNLETGGIISALFTYPYFLFWHNNQTTRLRLRYEWQIREGFSFTAQYEHTLELNQATQSYAVFHNRLFVGVELKPGRKSAKR